MHAGRDEGRAGTNRPSEGGAEAREDLALESRWAKTKNSREYHSVAFSHTGPNVYEETARCGLVARFWPRIGVRMDDDYCSSCTESVRRDHESEPREDLALEKHRTCDGCLDGCVTGSTRHCVTCVGQPWPCDAYTLRQELSDANLRLVRRSVELGRLKDKLNIAIDALNHLTTLKNTGGTGETAYLLASDALYQMSVVR